MVFLDKGSMSLCMFPCRKKGTFFKTWCSLLQKNDTKIKRTRIPRSELNSNFPPTKSNTTKKISKTQKIFKDFCLVPHSRESSQIYFFVGLFDLVFHYFPFFNAASGNSAGLFFFSVF